MLPHVIFATFCVICVYSDGENANPTNVDTTLVTPTFTLQRIRNQRLSMLRNYVLETLGFASPPRISELRTPTLEIIRQFRAKRIQENRCYLPSCSVPSRINQTMWSEDDNDAMNLYFDVLFSTCCNDVVVNATLKLHVKANPGSTGSRVAGTEEDSTNEPAAEPETQRIIVSVYQYTKPLKRRRKKIKLMAATMVIWSRVEYWVAFDVTEAVQEWSSDIRKNNGFFIKIQTFSDAMDITHLFGSPDCSAPLDTDCSSTDIPFLFPGSSNAVLEIFTEKDMFG